MVMRFRIAQGCVKCTPCPGEAAHNRPDRNAECICGVFVGKTINADVHQDKLLIRGKCRDVSRNNLKHKQAFRDLPAISTDKVCGQIHIHGFSADLLGSHFIKPDILSDPIHPTVQSRPSLPLLRARQSASARLLNKIVSLVQIARQGV